MCFTEYVNHTTSAVINLFSFFTEDTWRFMFSLWCVFQRCFLFVSAQHLKCVCTVIKIKWADPRTCRDTAYLISDYLEGLIPLFLFSFCFPLYLMLGPFSFPFEIEHFWISNVIYILIDYFPVLLWNLLHFTYIWINFPSRQPLVSIHFSAVWKSTCSVLRLVLVKQYITMSIMSTFIFVKVTLSLDGNTILSAAWFGKSALHCHTAVRLTLTKINADVMLTVMDYQSQPSLKSLQMYFHTTVEWIDITGHMVGRENTMLFHGKGQQ